MKKILIFLMIMPMLAVAKDYQVKLTVEGLPSDSSPKLLRIYNGNFYLVDSIPQIQGKAILFDVPDSVSMGTFQAILGTSDYDRYMGRQGGRTVNFLFDNNDVELSMNFADPAETLKVINSPVNKEYFDFLKKDAYFYKKLGTVEQVIINYPDKDLFYSQALDQYKRTQIERDNLIDSIYKGNPESLAARIIYRMKMPFLPGDVTNEERDSVFKSTFFDKLDFTDSVLLATNIYTDKIYQYLQVYMSANQTGGRDAQMNMIEAVDNIFPYINQNDFVRDNLVRFLLNSFEQMKMEEVLAHISIYYSDQCGSELEDMMHRYDKYQNMSLGNKVPDFTVYDTAGQKLVLSEQVSPYTLLVFWHSGCSHCSEMLQGMREMEEKGLFGKHKVQVITVSIDAEREQWLTYSRNNSLPWINTYAEDGYNSNVAKSYNIFATPTLFLLDAGHKIISKPMTIEELEKDLQKL
ncbi:MAG: thioredoxin family protein [Culturomica sp.]|jgi:peroxiredoxin|nr:thioredoxin family protein [Culturomica sp.]